MWNSMNIKGKLTAAFLVIGLFTAVVGAFGLNAAYRANDNTKSIYSDHLIPSTYLYAIQENLLRINDTFDLMLYEGDMLQSFWQIWCPAFNIWSGPDSRLYFRYVPSIPAPIKTEALPISESFSIGRVYSLL